MRVAAQSTVDIIMFLQLRSRSDFELNRQNAFTVHFLRLPLPRAVLRLECCAAWRLPGPACWAQAF